ncbi:hypothetical protein GQ43DRAFT_36128 [Delitschia confertaspora ATCC 74209]|uniref:Uncharacterized protein n=1 Tax=Delitschia confertaspora ATCC 74209 TaxID=1513339 RepID=A0A9P4JY32_9PLEO|nr:hypothetical protein GQ43DRAFT_36128 [Delitschia confertaspora ATCC 74209]
MCCFRLMDSRTGVYKMSAAFSSTSVTHETEFDANRHWYRSDSLHVPSFDMTLLHRRRRWCFYGFSLSLVEDTVLYNRSILRYLIFGCLDFSSPIVFLFESFRSIVLASEAVILMGQLVRCAYFWIHCSIRRIPPCSLISVRRNWSRNTRYLNNWDVARHKSL